MLSQSVTQKVFGKLKIPEIRNFTDITCMAEQANNSKCVSIWLLVTALTVICSVNICTVNIIAVIIQNGVMCSIACLLIVMWLNIGYTKVQPIEAIFMQSASDLLLW